MEIINLPFCENPYVYSNYLPQFISAIAHFPYLPLFILFTYNNLLNICRKFILIQIGLQLITMVGHLVNNPYYYYIPELSEITSVFYLFQFFNITSSENKKINIVVPIFSSISFIVCNYLFNLYISIFIHFTLLSVYLYNYNISDRLSRRYKIFLYFLYIFSFFILGIEVIFCENLLKYSSNFPWHICFDFLFWQISSNILLLGIINTNLKKIL